jgi:hypothetical protein
MAAIITPDSTRFIIARLPRLCFLGVLEYYIIIEMNFATLFAHFLLKSPKRAPHRPPFPPSPKRKKQGKQPSASLARVL